MIDKTSKIKRGVLLSFLIPKLINPKTKEISGLFRGACSRQLVWRYPDFALNQLGRGYSEGRRVVVPIDNYGTNFDRIVLN